MPRTTLTTPHEYEYLREVVVNVLRGKVPMKGNTKLYRSLVDAVAAELVKRQEPASVQAQVSGNPDFVLHQTDEGLVRDIFWDLSRQGYITLGDHNPNEWFRVSQFGANALDSDSPYQFHSTASYLALIQRHAATLPETRAYLGEASDTFYAGCLFSSSVMIGVAAEIEFLRLIDVAMQGAHNASFTIPSFVKAVAGLNVHSKIQEFRSALKPLEKDLAKVGIQDIETRFYFAQAVIRIARNDAGHAKSERVDRDLAYLNLKLFVPFAAMTEQLRKALG